MVTGPIGNALHVSHFHAKVLIYLIWTAAQMARFEANETLQACSKFAHPLKLESTMYPIGA